MISNQIINKKVKKSKKIVIKKIEELRDIILSIQGDEEEIKNFNYKYNYSRITDMSYMFYGCKSLKTIPYLNTSNVIDMSYMFYKCRLLKTIPQFDTSNVRDMSYMFTHCYSLRNIPFLDTSNVRDMSYMFYECRSLRTIPYLYNTSLEVEVLMFYGCRNLDKSNIDTRVKKNKKIIDYKKTIQLLTSETNEEYKKKNGKWDYLKINELLNLEIKIGVAAVRKYVNEYEKQNEVATKKPIIVIEPKIDKTKLYSKTPSEFLTLYKEKHITLKELIDYCRDLAMGKIYPFILHIIMEKNYENMLNEKDMLAIIKEVGILSIKYIPDYLTFKYGDSYELMIKNMMEKHFENNEEFNNYKNNRVFS
jgi:surface protein